MKYEQIRYLFLIFIFSLILISFVDKILADPVLNVLVLPVLTPIVILYIYLVTIFIEFLTNYLMLDISLGKKIYSSKIWTYKISKLIILCFLVLVLLGKFTVANPVLYVIPGLSLDAIFLIFFITVVIEFIIIYLIIDISLGKKNFFLFLIVVLYNLITLPIVAGSLSMGYIFDYYILRAITFFSFIFGMEGLIVVIEYLILRWFLSYLYEKKKILNDVESRTILASIILANIGSYSLGSVISGVYLKFIFPALWYI